MELLLQIVFYAARFVVETGFLLLALWFMVRIQKFQYTFLGILGSAAAASGLDMIPYVGHYLAVPVLYFCLLKVTREDFTGVIFTSSISYALVFGMNLFLFSSMIGNLRVSATERHRPSFVSQNTSDEEEADVEFEAPVMATPQTAAAQPPAVPTNSPAPKPATPAAKKDPAQGFSLKGITQSAKASMAMISSAGKTYTLAVGESATMETTDGKRIVTLDKVGESLVVLKVAGEQFELRR
jgi:hypothetical protein